MTSSRQGQAELNAAMPRDLPRYLYRRGISLAPYDEWCRAVLEPECEGATIVNDRCPERGWETCLAWLGRNTGPFTEG